jgi:hypothetical protein
MRTIETLQMKNALIAFLTLGIAAVFSPMAKAYDDDDQHHESSNMGIAP